MIERLDTYREEASRMVCYRDSLNFEDYPKFVARQVVERLGDFNLRFEELMQELSINPEDKGLHSRVCHLFQRVHGDFRRILKNAEGVRELYHQFNSEYSRIREGFQRQIRDDHPPRIIGRAARAISEMRAGLVEIENQEDDWGFLSWRMRQEMLGKYGQKMKDQSKNLERIMNLDFCRAKRSLTRLYASFCDMDIPQEIRERAKAARTHLARVQLPSLAEEEELYGPNRQARYNLVRRHKEFLKFLGRKLRPYQEERKITRAIRRAEMDGEIHSVGLRYQFLRGSIPPDNDLELARLIHVSIGLWEKDLKQLTLIKDESTHRRTVDFHLRNIDELAERAGFSL